jgi:hypothetical protein
VPSASDSATIRARLFTRAGCSLCDRACAILQRLSGEGLLAWEAVDISADLALTETYGSRIPVLELSTGDVFEGRVSEFRLRQRLTREQPLNK